MNVQKFRKKPVEIEAMELRGGNSRMMDVYRWVESNIGSTYPPCDDFDHDEGTTGITIDPADGQIVIRTLEGDMKATPGDWIIRGVQGEFYPCKPDIFAATYDSVSGGAA
ncbi:hypothetical protein ACMTN4_07360 [Rhodococcus globerulus]|uniref:hypothetical protein n=1 Tax=Rhodococcus globerulus TaxID=33008 RepID=UPI0039E8734F